MTKHHEIMIKTRIRAKTIRTRTRKKCTRTCGRIIHAYAKTKSGEMQPRQALG